MKIENMVKKCYEEHPFPDYPDSFNDFDSEFQKLVKWYSIVFKFLGFSKKYAPKKILCAGCGTGEETIALSKLFPGSEIFAIDISTNSLKKAENLAKKMDVHNVEYMRMSILAELPKLDKKFDLVLSAGVIHHLENPLQGFKNLAEKMEDEGDMVISLYSTYGDFVYKLEVLSLDILAGKNIEKRKSWAEKLGFDKGTNKASFSDYYLNPQVKTYTIGEVRGFAKSSNLILDSVVPPLFLDDAVEFGRKFQGDSMSRKILYDFAVFFTGILPKSRTRKGRIRKSSFLREKFFEFVYLVMDKGFFYYRIRK